MTRLTAPILFTVVVLVCSTSKPTVARDFVLTIGGGYAPSGNQASLEKNVLLFHRVLKSQPIEPFRSDTLFADGKNPERDLQVIDAETVPKANRLMAEFFGSGKDLGLSYRNHQVPNVYGASKPEQLRRWFKDVKKQIAAKDRLVIYVTAHGQKSRDRDRAYNTSLAMWDNSSIQMTGFAKLLDDLPNDIQVVMVMVQCYTGGFSHLMYRGGDPKLGLSPQRRVGFYATVHDRPAAGCTPEADETNYAEYSTYFWAALSGVDRAGNAIELPDYDGNGWVSFEEAHAYTILTAETIDLPVKTSGEFLSLVSRFGSDKSAEDDDVELLNNDEPYSVVLKYASPVQRRVLSELSRQLELDGEKRLVDAWRSSRPQRGRGRTRQVRESEQLRRTIAKDTKNKWPELANVLNPKSIELVTTGQERFIQAIEEHPKYAPYLEQKSSEEASEDDQHRRVKFERFLRVADNVLMAENLRRLGKEKQLQEYESIVAAERTTLKPR